MHELDRACGEDEVRVRRGAVEGTDLLGGHRGWSEVRERQGGGGDGRPGDEADDGDREHAGRFAGEEADSAADGDVFAGSSGSAFCAGGTGSADGKAYGGAEADWRAREGGARGDYVRHHGPSDGGI